MNGCYLLGWEFLNIVCAAVTDVQSVWCPDGHLELKAPVHHRNQSSSITINITKVSRASFQSYLKHQKEKETLYGD